MEIRKAKYLKMMHISNFATINENYNYHGRLDDDGYTQLFLLSVSGRISEGETCIQTE
jgi:hypothetical protein